MSIWNNYNFIENKTFIKQKVIQVRTFHILKHYFDFISLDKRTILYIYFIKAEVLGKKLGIVEIHGRDANGKPIKLSKSFFNYNDPLNTGMVIGNNVFEQNCNSSQINMSIDNTKLDLTYNRIGSPWKATKDSVIIQKNVNKFIKWSVEQPSSNVSGRISMNNVTEEISGLGYHDVVEMNIPPWKIPMKRIYWGRAQCGLYNVVYNIVISRKGKIFKYLMVQQGGINVIQPDSFELTESDNVTKITGVGICLKLGHLENIENSKIADRSRIHSAIMRFFLNVTGGEPVEKKYYSSAELYYENKKHYGDAIHEMVLWNGGN